MTYSIDICAIKNSADRYVWADGGTEDDVVTRMAEEQGVTADDIRNKHEIEGCSIDIPDDVVRDILRSNSGLNNYILAQSKVVEYIKLSSNLNIDPSSVHVTSCSTGILLYGSEGGYCGNECEFKDHSTRVPLDFFDKPDEYISELKDSMEADKVRNTLLTEERVLNNDKALWKHLSEKYPDGLFD